MPYIPFGNYGTEQHIPFLRVDQLIGGRITGRQIILAGGTRGVIRSENYVPGSSGWAIFGDGSAEFASLSISVGFDDVGASGTGNTSGLIIAAAGTMESSDWTPSGGTTGWVINGDGTATFQDVTVRGTLNAADLVAGTIAQARFGASTVPTSALIELGNLSVTGTLTLSGSGEFKTAADGNERLEITQAAADRILFKNSSDVTTVSIGNYAGLAGLLIEGYNSGNSTTNTLLNYSGGQVMSIGSPIGASGAGTLRLGTYSLSTFSSGLTINKSASGAWAHSVQVASGYQLLLTGTPATASDPQLALQGSGDDTGIWFDAIDSFYLVVGGTEMFHLNTDGIAYENANTVFPTRSSATPTQITSFAAAATWYSTGTTTLWTHGGTNRAVEVTAEARFTWGETAAVAYTGECRLGVSFDGGSTWSYGAQSIAFMGTGTGGCGYRSDGMVMFQGEAASATGDIQMRLEYKVSNTGMDRLTNMHIKGIAEQVF